jgi:hypothetical protein
MPFAEMMTPELVRPQAVFSGIQASAR